MVPPVTTWTRLPALLLAGVALVLFQRPAPAADTLAWSQSDNRVSAEIGSWDLGRLLPQLARVTGWQIYLEPETRHTVSTKFRDLPPGEALRRLLGDLSFALVPATNGPSRLFVFRTSVQEATQLIRPAVQRPDPTARPIPNELVVTLKKGAKIEDLARLLGARIVGRADALNTYRLAFDTAEQAQSARETLRNNPDVESVDSNFWMLPPDPSDSLALSSGPAINLKPRDAGDCNKPIIGLIDTAVQKTGGPMDAFLLPSLSVAGEARLPDNTPSHGTSMFETVLRGLSARSRETTVKVLPVDVYGNSPTTTTFDVANGVMAAINNGANVINLSLGSSGDSEFLRRVIQRASEQNVIFLAAAGNEPGTTPTYPAAYPQVMAVTARARDGSIAPYANRGEFVDLAAPGSSIVSFGGQTWLVTGTSASAAFASGVAASLVDCSKLTPAQISTAMQAMLPVKPGP